KGCFGTFLVSQSGVKGVETLLSLERRRYHGVMRRQTLRGRRARVISILMLLLVGCKTKTREGRDGIREVVIDLNKVAPIGYEICAEHPPKLSAANVNL